MAAEIVLAQNGQISEPREVGPGARITVSGSGWLEWAPNTLADVRNGVVTWQPWPKGQAAGFADTSRRMVVRARATGAVQVDIDETRRDPGPEGVFWQEQEGSTVRPEDFGAVGDGATDDSTALLGAINAAAVRGGVVKLEPGRTYNVRGDVLSWNAHNVVLASDGIGHGLGVALPATIRFTTGGVFGLRIGLAANYPAGLQFGNAIKGVRLNFNGQVFSDAALVMEGLTRFKLEDSAIFNTGAGTRAARFRCVWDSTFLNNYCTQLYNTGAAIFDLDNFQTDASGNNNNLRWAFNHFENFDGALFFARSSANLDLCQWVYNKFEMGGSGGNLTSNFIFDLRSCSQNTIANNTFNGIDLATRYAGVVRIGEGASAHHTVVRDNALNNIAGAWMHMGQFAINSIIVDNRHFNSSGALTVRNQAVNQNIYIAPYSSVNMNRVDVEAWDKQIGSGWLSAGLLGPGSGDRMLPDIASVATGGTNNATTPSGAGAVLRQTTTAQGTIICQLPFSKFRDFPVAVTLYVRARRTQPSGTTTLQVNLNGSSIAQAAAFDAAPTAVGSISFTGNGTTVTATLAGHTFKVGDRIVVTGTTNYNTTVGQPAQVLTVPDANTFTFAGAGNAGAQTGSAQLLPWQIVTFTLPTGTFSGITPPDTNGTLGGLGRDSGDRFRLEYGSGNTQAIDVDAIAFRF